MFKDCDLLPTFYSNGVYDFLFGISFSKDFGSLSKDTFFFFFGGLGADLFLISESLSFSSLIGGGGTTLVLYLGDY